MREVGTGQVTKTVVDGVARLTAQEVSPEPLLELVRGHGFIKPRRHGTTGARRRGAKIGRTWDRDMRSKCWLPP